MPQWLKRKDVLWTCGLAALLVSYLVFGDAADSCQRHPHTVAAATGQGSDAVAEGEPVTVEGTVTGVFLGADALNGFFLQSSRGSDGPVAVFVYAPGLDGAARERVRPGARLQVTGTADRFHGRPQIGYVDGVHRCGAPQTVEPAPLELPLAEADRPVMEGLLVRYPEELVVTGNYHLGRFGTLKLAPERRFRERSDDDIEPVLLLDDGSYRSDPEPAPYLDADSGTRRVGDRLQPVTGIVTYAFDDWRLHPVEAPEFRTANPRPDVPADVGGDVRAAAFNVENYFLTLGERGASNEPELERQRQRLLPALAGLQADLLGLVEVENDPAALADLVRRASDAVPGPAYRGLSAGDAGSDAIKVSLAYRPERLELVAGPFRDDRDVHHRPPQAAVFRVPGGEPFLAAVVHFKSKTRCPDSGDVDRGQGCWNERRTAQARALREFVSDGAAEHGVDDVLLLGDFNSYAGEDPIRLLEESGFRNLVARDLPAERQYSYVFRGASGTLDYALATPSMAERVAGTEVWHINADEPPVFEYQGRLGDAPQVRGTPYRSSDHDPLLIGISN